MNMCTQTRLFIRGVFLLLGLMLSACATPTNAGVATRPTASVIDLSPTETPALPEPTPFPTRPEYAPGELVDYTAQTGDTLPALAARFNTTVPQILNANPFIPTTATTMPPGMPMKIPIYYKPLWGTPYQIIPDGLFVNGPSQIGFAVRSFRFQQGNGSWGVHEVRGDWR